MYDGIESRENLTVTLTDELLCEAPDALVIAAPLHDALP
jgi:hypothetical protein